jgi:hypothetical protein
MARRLFRVTYVDGLKTWEKKSPDISIAMRVLYQFCKWRLLKDMPFDEFVGNLPIENYVTLMRVLQVSFYFLSYSSYMFNICVSS